MRYIFIFSFFFLPFLVNSQTGPGGIGNSLSNGLWLRAGDINQADNSPVFSWSDQSGNSNDAQQMITDFQPIFLTSSLLNGQAVVRLDGSNDRLIVGDADILDGTSGLTFYAVVRPRNLNNAPRGILGKRITFTTNTDYAYTWFFWTQNRIFNDINTGNNRYNSGSQTYSNSNNYILSFDFNGNLPISERSRLYTNGNLNSVATESSNTVINSASNLVLGALNDNYSSYLGADYAEVIHFNYSLDSVEHIIVSNYLSAKYNIPLSTRDLYVQDKASQGNFDFDVAGIGKVNDAILHDDAQGSGIVRILNPNNLDDDEYLIWGHNNQAPVATNFSDVPEGVDARFERVWRVSEVNGALESADVGSINIRWDLNGLGPVTANDLVLLVDTDNDGFFVDESEIVGATALGGGIYEFALITAIEDSLRFTIGTSNSIRTTLPVEYLSFSGSSFENYNLIEWETASEIDNDFFSVLKSGDLHEWTELARIKSKSRGGAENIHYSFKDRQESTGMVYYKLKQTDVNGAYSYSNIVQIKNRSNGGALLLYPNPSSDIIYLTKIKGDIALYDSKGEDISESCIIEEMGSDEFRIFISHLPKGTYFVKTQTSFKSFIKN
jgi:hypothetical protein